MPDFLDSHSRLPKHPLKEWNQTLELARSLGWYFRKTSDHAFGHLYCRTGVPKGGAVCDITIFSSGRGGESAARFARRAVSRCPHGPD